MKISTLLATKGSNVVTVHSGQPVQAAIALFVQHNIGALVVVDDVDTVVGLLSERHIVRALPRLPDLLAQPVGQVMSRDRIIVSPQDDVVSVMQAMTEKRFRYLLVMDQGKLAGIVSIGDVIKAQLEEYQGAIETLETQIIEG
jgi:CBS domain-containing protein